MSELPVANSEYSKRSYWNERYENESSSEWLVGYSSLKHLIEQSIPKTAKILMLGCGNSMLSEQMHLDGYETIHSIDYSETVISRMAKHCEACARLEWSVMDARQLGFEDNSFDAVIEKATLDAMLAEEKDPWTLSAGAEEMLSQVLGEVSRVLRGGGSFVSISFSQPHFRAKVYAEHDYGWHLEAMREIGTCFHFYYYHLIKSGKWREGEGDQRVRRSYEPPRQLAVSPVDITSAQDSSADDKRDSLMSLLFD